MNASMGLETYLKSQIMQIDKLKTFAKPSSEIGKCAFGDSTLNDNELLNVKEVKRGATFTSLIFY